MRNSNTLPSGSLLNNYFPIIHYQDSFSIEVNSDKELVADDLIRLFLTSAPTWVVRLMKLRDKVADVLHLKTQSDSQNEHIRAIKKSSYVVGNKFALFELTEKNNKEAVLGADDTHLNFRVSLFLNPSKGGNNRLSISTIVEMHNKTGQVYFKAIRPFHKAVVKSFLKRMKVNIESGNNSIVDKTLRP